MAATVLSDKPVVGSGGGVYVAPAGTTVPKTISALKTTPFKALGLVSEDGLAWTPPAEQTQDINVWQLQFPWDVVTTGFTSQFSFSLAQWSRDTLDFVLGGTGTWNDEPSTTPTNVYYEPPVGIAAPLEYVVGLHISTSSGNEVGVVFPRCRVTERAEVPFQKGAASMFGVTVTMLGDEEVAPYRLIFDAASMPVSA